MTLKKKCDSEFVITLEKKWCSCSDSKETLRGICDANATATMENWRGEREKKMAESEKEKEVRKAVKLGESITYNK